MEAIAGALAEAGVEIQTMADARPSLWEKLSYLAPFSALTAAARLPIGSLWQSEATRDAFADGVREVAQVARAEGVRLPEGLAEKFAAFVSALPPSARSSLLMDLQNGRRIEVEALQGTVVRRGARAGVPTPMLSALYAVLKPYEHGSVAV